MVVIKLTEPLRVSEELWGHLVARGIIGTDEGDYANLVCYIQECLARDDGRVPVTLQKNIDTEPNSKNIIANADIESVSAATAMDGSLDVTEQLNTHETVQPKQSALSASQIVSRLTTLYNSGGTK